MADVRIELYWLPVGAGEPTGLVRLSGRAYEAASARLERRPSRPLFHSALRVFVDDAEFVVEMAPVWASDLRDRGVVAEGAVGRPWLGRSRWFRYEIRCWRGGVIPDRAYAVGGPVRIDTDPARVERFLRAVRRFPTATWGRDEQRAGEMWNSNSLVSWALSVSGHDLSDVVPPMGGRAPGWAAGMAVAARDVAARDVAARDVGSAPAAS
ncbi:hypothetical protein [Marmoricola sp. URHB0036]|uniref:hypothetical protein n=1 Tax=Marmoricola sp. URHB0036 TaxID=1298863 RepID=UPI0006888B2D|nr:hypothetical protein [Marmoricola sp. URHB0036]